MKPILPIALLSSLLFVVACPQSPPPDDDAGSDSDAGEPGDDDAGPEQDGGAPDDDGGAPDHDGGAPDDDGGSPGDADAGPPPDVTSGSWSTSYGLPGALGFGARVSAFAKASDGAVYVGGTFTHLGGTPASNVARYDDGTFSALADGLPGWVYALALDNEGNLYAGGWLVDDEVGGDNHLMRWDGEAWEPLGPALDGEILALAFTSDGTVVVGGSFWQFSETDSGGLAMLDGNTFVPLGGGAPDGNVNVIYEDDALGLCVGGFFSTIGAVSASSVACFDDGVWTQLGDGLNSDVHALVRDSTDELLIGGGFSFFDELDPFSSEVGLARLVDGAFVSHAGGVVDGSVTKVRSLSLLPSGQVLVGGCFAGVGVGEAQIYSPHAALLNADGSWAAPDDAGGLVNTIGMFGVGFEGAHATVVTDSGDVLVGGLFTEAAEQLAPNLARLDDDGFHTVADADKDFLGISGLVNEMAADDDGALYLGGYFSWAGTMRAENVVKLEGGDYSALGGGLDGSVHALVVLPDGTVVAGGDFYAEPGGLEVPFLAQFKEGAWQSVAGAPDGPVFALALDDDGNLLVGGDFGSIGGHNAARIARIVGSDVQPFGPGLDARVTGIATDADGDVVASGLFAGNASNPLNGIARYDGASWSAVGGGIDNDDYGSTVGRYQGDIVVGGSFESIGGVPAKGLARFDGSGWSDLGDGLSSEFGLTLVTDVVTWGPVLFATGIFDSAGEQPASYVAVYDGEDWYPLGGGLNDLGESVVVDAYGLTVGGPFVSVDDGTPSIGVARYTFGP